MTGNERKGKEIFIKGKKSVHWRKGKEGKERRESGGKFIMWEEESEGSFSCMLENM